MIDLAQVTDIEVDGIDFKDYPDFADAYVSSALLQGRPMTDSELDELNRDGDFVNQVVFNKIY